MKNIINIIKNSKINFRKNSIEKKVKTFINKNLSKADLLEIKGAKFTNWFRLFLLVNFLLAVIISVKSGSLSENVIYFVIANIAYGISFLLAFLVLKFNKYDTRLKYIHLVLEVSALFLVLLSYALTDDPALWTRGVRHPSMLSLLFLYIGISLLYFTPRFCISMGVAVVLVYNSIYIYLISYLLVPLTIKSDPFNALSLSVSDWVILNIFLIALTILVSSAALFFKNIIADIKTSEKSALTNFEVLKEVIEKIQMSVVNMVTEVATIIELAKSYESKSQDQLAATEETSAAIEQMGASIKSIADQALEQDKISANNSSSLKELGLGIDKIVNASKKNQDRGKTILDNALMGEQDLNKTARVIEKIDTGSEQVADIVSLINGIAKKTNLLALNAAIEAARAGEEGRGFSVVADEIGRLAEEASSNASAIEKLIKTTRTDTREGVEIVKTTVMRINTIIEGIKEIAEMNSSIYTSVSTQSTASKTVIVNMEKIQSIAMSMRNATIEQENGADEIVKAVDNITNAAENFSQSTNNLYDSIKRIEVSAKELGEEANNINLEKLN